jgi:hypothetical protein
MILLERQTNENDADYLQRISTVIRLCLTSGSIETLKSKTVPGNLTINDFPVGFDTKDQILNQVSGYKSKIVGYDEDGLPVTEMVKLDVKKELDGINLDTADSYVLEMVVDNSERIRLAKAARERAMGFSWSEAWRKFGRVMF